MKILLLVQTKLTSEDANTVASKNKKENKVKMFELIDAFLG
jgi:hypothetical protein